MLDIEDFHKGPFVRGEAFRFIVMIGDCLALWVFGRVSAITLIRGEVRKGKYDDGNVIGTFTSDAGKAEMACVRRFITRTKTAEIFPVESLDDSSPDADVVFKLWKFSVGDLVSYAAGDRS